MSMIFHSSILSSSSTFDDKIIKDTCVTSSLNVFLVPLHNLQTFFFYILSFFFLLIYIILTRRCNFRVNSLMVLRLYSESKHLQKGRYTPISPFHYLVRKEMTQMKPICVECLGFHSQIGSLSIYLTSYPFPHKFY